MNTKVKRTLMVLSFVAFILVGFYIHYLLAAPEELKATLERDLAKLKSIEKKRPGTLVLFRDSQGKTLLHSAVDIGEIQVAEYLIGVGVPVDEKSDDGETALHAAAFWGRPDLIRLLIRNDADVNAKDEDGWTPLHKAAFRDNRDAIQTLLAAEAAVGAKNAQGNTPLDLAKYHAHIDTGRLIAIHEWTKLKAPEVQMRDDWPSEFRALLKDLYAADAPTRALAAIRLRRWATVTRAGASHPQIPFLIGLLGDCEEITGVGTFVPTRKSTPGYHAMRTLIEASTDSADALVAALGSQNIRVRNRSAFALGEIGSTQAIAPLISLLKQDAVPESRDVAARALCKILTQISIHMVTHRTGIRRSRDESGFRDAIQALVGACKDEAAVVRECARDCIASVGEDMILPEVDKLSDTDPAVRKAAAKALARWSGEDFGEDADSWGKWWRQFSSATPE
jgi:hypothetical protein